MAAERAEILPLLPHFDVFREKNIFPLDVITFPRRHRGGWAERSKRPGGRVSCFFGCFLISPSFYIGAVFLSVCFKNEIFIAILIAQEGPEAFLERDSTVLFSLT